MGIKLVEEVVNHAPRELSHGERWLLVCLAQHARDETRLAWPGREWLMHTLGTEKWDTVASTLRGLASKGYEVRVPRGVGSDGRTHFASKGTQTTYRIPELRSRSDSVRANNVRTSQEVTRSDESSG